VTALLQVRDLNKRFGGVLATQHVDLAVAAGSLHALIGPNGAGKTTLVAQLAGQLASDSGQVLFDGQDITRLRAHQRARRGLVRSFQITRLFKSFAVREQLALAAQAVTPGTFNPWRPASRDAAPAQRADELLEELGLAGKGELSVSALSHGEQRALEVGLALASRPRLVLLDEPMAGLGPDESRHMEALLQRLRRQTTLLLIEHDVEAVFRLADEVTVLVNGAVIASGPPSAVRTDPQVVEAYLGAS
jgi:branched-chain amino acid transport system ATP-binding protein